MNSSIIKLREIFLIAALISISYANIFHNQYVWDDHHVLEKNPYLTHLETLPTLFWKDNTKMFFPEAGQAGYWRPLFFSSYYIDQWLPVGLPLAHHLVDILIYLGCCLAVLCLAREFIRDEFSSLIATVFFVLWPLHTEGVTFMGGRCYSLCGIGWIGSLIFFRKYLRDAKTKWIGYAAIFFAASLLVHELSIVVPLLLAALIYMEWKEMKGTLRNRRAALSMLLFGVIVFAYLVIRRRIAPIHSYGPEGLSWAAVLQSGATAFRVAQGIVWPYSFTLVTDPPPIISKLSDAIFGSSILLVGLVTTWFGLRRKASWCWIFLWILVPVLLVVSPWPRGAVYQDRYTFLPSIGTALAAGFVSWKVRRDGSKRTERLACLLAGCWILSFIPTTLARNLDWRNDEALWCTEASKYPNSFEANKNCGWALQQAHQFERALTLYYRALSIRMDSFTANNYAMTLAILGNCEKAAGIFKTLRTREPQFKEAWINEISCLETLGRSSEAQKVKEAEGYSLAK